MDDKPLTWLQLESLIPLQSTKGEPSVESVTSLSVDTIQRLYSHFIRKPSKRRRGMKLRTALAIAADGIEARELPSPMLSPASVVPEATRQKVLSASTKDTTWETPDPDP